MNVQENCIQLKIDTIISDINQNNQDNQNEEKNQITALIGYSHCIDLFDFLQIFSKVQKNELLVQTALIYDSIGYTELSMDYINESLLLIPNVPSIILFKSGLFATLNKLDEAQKWLLKYKYLIGENIYDNYIHDSFLVILYYLLEYEEHIILRKINSIENKYSKYVTDNIVIFYIKSKTLEKFAQKIKNSDKKRYISYNKESNEIAKKYINNKKVETEFLFEQGIKSENVTKLLILINPNLLNYKPKKLIEYKKGFNKSGFSLFYILIKICKILKLKIETKKFLKINKTTNNEDINNLKDINSILKYIEENSEINNLPKEEKEKNYIETIKKISNSIWLKGLKNNDKKIEIKKVVNTDIVKGNYYIQEGYYSHLNLKEYILKNIEYNNNYKQNKLELNYFLNEEIKTENNDEPGGVVDNKNISINNDEVNSNELKIILVNKKTEKHSITKNKEEKDKEKEKEKIENKNLNNNNDNAKISKKEIKKESTTNSNKTRTKIIKNSLSDIIKKVITGNLKDTNKNKRNKNINENRESKKSKKFCSTDNCNNQIKSQNIHKKKIDIIKIEPNTVLNNKINEEKINHNKKEKIKYNSKEKNKEKEENTNKIKDEVKNDKPQSDKNSNEIIKNCNNKNYLTKKNKEKEIKTINIKNKLLTTNSSNKRMTLVNSNDRVKPFNKKFHNNQMGMLKEEKKMDTDYGKYKDVREINLVSYCLKQLMKKKENKNKNTKQKEFGNLTDKIDLVISQKVPDLEKQILQINEHKFIKSKSKKKKFINKSTKKQINTFTFEKKMKKGSQKHSDNNLINTNKSSYGANCNNMKNLKRSINNYGNKKEISKFKSLNYLHGNFYSNNNYLNINFNNYMNYNFNYSNRHEDKKNFDFRFNLNSDNKKRDGSNSKDKFNFRTINLDFKNMSTKLSSNYTKKPLLNSFLDSKDKNKKSSDNKYDFVIMPFNKIKNSPSSETNCLKKKLKNFKANLINPKKKTSFSKYMLYNMSKKTDPFYFSKSINTSEYNKYKNSSSNKSKTMKNKYNKTITNKSNSKINNK